MTDRDQRTEKPTPRRLERARKQGNVPASKELVIAVQWLVFASLSIVYADRWMEGGRELMRALIERAFNGVSDPDALLRVPRALLLPVVLPLVTGASALAVAALAAHGSLTRLQLSTGRLKPDFQRLNPADRLRRLPAQNMSQAGIALLVLVAFGFFVGWLVEKSWQPMLILPHLPLVTGLIRVSAQIEDLLWKAAGLLLLLGLWDAYRQHSRWAAQLRMTKQEVREEAKDTDGNPQMKMRIRRLMRERSRRRMTQEVAKATAVIVNPTHYAVAIRYTPGEMRAPRVVAKGQNYLAGRIRERAIRHQIPIVENPPLAQALYRTARVGQEIPAHLYRAVAEVLAYLYRLLGGRLPG
jgi:flagellar biosynthetic protein FlhB